MNACNEIVTDRKFPEEMRLYTQNRDPRIQFKIPVEMLLEVTLCAIESGHSVESEILVRLAHSLLEKEQCVDEIVKKNP